MMKKLTPQDLMHGQSYRGQNVAGWFWTEKVDGVRGIWDGSKFWTRSGREIEFPEEMKRELPRGVAIEGELWSRRGRAHVAGLCRKANSSREDWAGVKWFIFDAPGEKGNIVERISRALEKSKAMRFVEWMIVQELETTGQALEKARNMIALGAEGIMVKHPDHPYTAGRTNKLLKLTSETLAL